MEKIPSFNELIQQSIMANWDMDALTDYKGQTLQYHDVARKIEKVHILFENSGVQKGDWRQERCRNYGTCTDILHGSFRVVHTGDIYQFAYVVHVSENRNSGKLQSDRKQE